MKEAWTLATRSVSDKTSKFSFERAKKGTQVRNFSSGCEELSQPTSFGHFKDKMIVCVFFDVKKELKIRRERTSVELMLFALLATSSLSHPPPCASRCPNGLLTRSSPPPSPPCRRSFLFSTSLCCFCWITAAQVRRCGVQDLGNGPRTETRR